MPWPTGGCVTAVTTRPAFSKLSAVAPLVPVITLNVSGVSSNVVTVSEVMSATAVTVIATVFVSVSAPSEVATVSRSAPL